MKLQESVIGKNRGQTWRTLYSFLYAIPVVKGGDVNLKAHIVFIAMYANVLFNIFNSRKEML